MTKPGAKYDPESDTVVVRWAWDPDSPEEMTMEEFRELAKPENLLVEVQRRLNKE